MPHHVSHLGSIPCKHMSAILVMVSRQCGAHINDMQVVTVTDDFVHLASPQIHTHVTLFSELYVVAAARRIDNDRIMVEMSYRTVTFGGGQNGVDIARVEIIREPDGTYSIGFANKLEPVTRIITLPKYRAE